MTARHERLERLGPSRSATGRCGACDHPAYVTELGWFHLGEADEAQCRRDNLTTSITFVPDHHPGAPLAAAITAVVCTIATVVTAQLLGPLTLLWAVAFAALLASVVYPGVRAGQILRAAYQRSRQ